MLVAALKERVAQPISITIMEPRAQLGAGVAYSTQCAAQLLNTRAGNMSVNSTPGGFVNWLYAFGPLARGSHWELTAVQEIREQAQHVAADIRLA